MLWLIATDIVGGDRFKLTWQVADQVRIGTYNDLEFTVTERVNKTK